MSDKQPRIYVACLASYNAGILHGEWIDADQDAEDIQAEIDAMLEASPEPDAEEWAIHDYEDFGDLSLSEYESIERVALLGQMVAVHGAAFAAYAAHVGTEHATEEGFQDAYCGEYATEQDFAEEYYTNNQEVPSHLESYIDWARVAGDLFMSGYYSIRVEGDLYVFRNC